MQCGAGARPEWAGKRLVAVKRMKKKWEGGWEECQKLKELEVCPLMTRSIPLLMQYDVVVTCNPLPSQYHPSLRFLPPSRIQGTLFRF